MKNIISILAFCLIGCGTPAIIDTMDSSTDTRHMEMVTDAADTTDAAIDATDATDSAVSETGPDAVTVDSADSSDASDAVSDVTADLGPVPTDSGTCLGCWMPDGTCVTQTLDHCGSTGSGSWCTVCPASTDPCNVSACNNGCVLQPTPASESYWMEFYDACTTAAGVHGYCQPDQALGISGPGRYPSCITAGMPGQPCAHGEVGSAHPEDWGCFGPNPVPPYDAGSPDYEVNGPWQAEVFVNASCPLDGICP